MPLFIFDHDCVDRRVTYAYQQCCCDVRSRGCNRPFLLAVTGVVGGMHVTWRIAVGTTWVGTRDQVRSNLSTSLRAYCWLWREGVLQAGVADGMAQQLCHRYSGIVIFCLLLDSFDP